MNNRKTITPKIKLEVFKRDNYTCITCGRSPVTNPGLSLEVDHKEPFSKGGSDDLSNYQTLCIQCNRGKGANENLNKILKNDIDIILNNINPEILKLLQISKKVKVVANQEDFLEISKKNSNNEFYQIQVIPNTIIGFQAGYNLGIYTISDNYGPKINFTISLAEANI